MKVALINPPFSKLVYGEEHSIKSITPCLGLFSLEAYCRDIAEFRIFEGEFFSGMSGLIDAINSYAPDVLGVTTNTSTYPLCRMIAQQVEARHKFAGGPYSSFRVEESLRDFDIVFIGDAEVGLRAFLQGQPLKLVPGIAYRNTAGRVCSTAPAPLPPLDAIPLPNHRAMQIGLYQASPHRELQSPFATMMTSRGCGFSCSFCLSANGGMNSGKYRVRSVEHVIAEIEILTREFGVKSIQFWDDTFTMRKDRTKELCDALRPFNLTYVCNTRTDKMDDETAEMLYNSGCRGVFFGVESGHDMILKNNMSKGVENAQVVNAVKSCKRAGLQTTASYIFGSIDDTYETIMETVRFSLQLDTDFVLYNIYTAHPGTAGYYEALRQGIIDEYIVDVDRWRGEPVGVPTVCRQLSRQELHALKADAYIRYYTSRDAVAYESIIRTYQESLDQLRRNVL